MTHTDVRPPLWPGGVLQESGHSLPIAAFKLADRDHVVMGVLLDKAKVGDPNPNPLIVYTVSTGDARFGEIIRKRD